MRVQVNLKVCINFRDNLVSFTGIQIQGFLLTQYKVYFGHQWMKYRIQEIQHWDLWGVFVLAVRLRDNIDLGLRVVFCYIEQRSIFAQGFVALLL